MKRLAARCTGCIALSIGCTASRPATDDDCPMALKQPLIHASAVESYLGIADAQRRALVAILDEADERSLCSGVFIASTWVLTAAHCDELSRPVVEIPAGSTTPSTRLPVVRRELLKGADIAVFQVGFSSAEFGDEHQLPRARHDTLDALSLGVSPLATPTRELTRIAPEVAVELAGYGRNEAGGAGELRFLVEQVLAVTPTHITVSGFGRSGACEGDSGGPLLVRGEDGDLVVAGVLSRGSNTCLHEDDYVRTDVTAVWDWIDSKVELPAPSFRECGTISTEGRCVYGAALWCHAGTLAAELCATGTTCGWSPAARGFRCVPHGAPCGGVDNIGECRHGESVRCVAGHIRREYCGACASCRVDGRTGVPFCSSADQE